MRALPVLLELPVPADLEEEPLLERSWEATMALAFLHLVVEEPVASSFLANRGAGVVDFLFAVTGVLLLVTMGLM